jgi:Glycosyl hydrolases family 35
LFYFTNFIWFFFFVFVFVLFFCFCFLKQHERYLAINGGPIIAAQIENEYTGGELLYLNWIASLVKNYSK